ncbi:MAG: pyridoxamine 5'-phosphate oxidase family protein [Anaerolineae bacterium]
MSWKDLETGDPELAALGAERFARFGVAYLATLRRDGSPRVHPVTPIIGQGRLFLFMEPTSPKGHDLRRDGRYALHSAVSDSSGDSGEFFIAGCATFRDDPATRRLAAESASYAPADRYVLFELDVESAASTLYNDGQPVRQHWKASEDGR